MITVETADNALKSFYLDAVTDALDMKISPFLAKVQRTTSNVVGKDVKKLVRLGYNSGVGAGSEDGDLPKAKSGEFVQFTTSLKNIYGTIEISDKAIRASANNEGAFVNLLNDEMQSLVKSASMHFGRMLFGNGDGRIATVAETLNNNYVVLESVSGITEGMLVDLRGPLGEEIEDSAGLTVLEVERPYKRIRLSGYPLNSTLLPKGSGVHLQGSYGYELTGLSAIFDMENPLYGVDRTISAMYPYIQDDVGAISAAIIEKAMDSLEEETGSKINLIICSWGVKRALVEALKAEGVVLPTVEVEGQRALDFFGVPIITDRFCPKGTMYLLNTDDFKLHQLCDWQWLQGEDGKILKQVPGKPVYTATLVKYAELMCERPCGQGRLTGITEA